MQSTDLSLPRDEHTCAGLRRPEHAEGGRSQCGEVDEAAGDCAVDAFAAPGGGQRAGEQIGAGVQHLQLVQIRPLGRQGARERVVAQVDAAQPRVVRPRRRNRPCEQPISLQQ